MRLSFIRAALSAVVLLCACQMSAQNPANPIQVALLRWYQANTAAQIPTCPDPQGMAFDGSHIWVACNGGTDHALQELNASDGALVQTVSGVSSAYGLVYDGANVWVSDYGTDTVSKVNASTGAVLGSYSVGTQPTGLAFDGQYVWVANYGSNSLSQLLATSGTVVNTYSFSPTICDNPRGLAYDGAYLWVACFNSASVLKVNPSNGSAVAIMMANGVCPAFIAYDGETSQPGGPFVWVTSASSAASVSRIGTTSLALTQFAVGNNPYFGIVFDGLYIWVGNGSSNTVTKLLQSTGAVVGTYATGGPAMFLGFDGGNVWVSNHGAGTLSKM